MQAKRPDQRCIIANSDNNYICLSDTAPINDDFQIHSVIKALIDSKGTESKGGTVFVRYLPCQICCSALVVAGIKKLVYKEEEPETPERIASEQLLIEAGIDIIHNQNLDI